MDQVLASLKSSFQEIVEKGLRYEQQCTQLQSHIAAMEIQLREMKDSRAKMVQTMKELARVLDLPYPDIHKILQRVKDLKDHAEK